MDSWRKRLSKVAHRKITALKRRRGVVTVENTNMERALRRIYVERGHGQPWVCSASFAEPVGRMSELARALRIPVIIVPESAGHSAPGVLTADVVKTKSAQSCWKRRLELRKNKSDIQRDGTAGCSDATQRRVCLCRCESMSVAGDALQGQSFELKSNRQKRPPTPLFIGRIVNATVMPTGIKYCGDC